jgi:hypothetical protein
MGNLSVKSTMGSAISAHRREIKVTQRCVRCLMQAFDTWLLELFVA